MDADHIEDTWRTAKALTQRATRAVKWSEAVRAESAEIREASRGGTQARRESRRPDVAVEELWLAYAAAGGACSLLQVNAHLETGSGLPELEIMILAQAAQDVLRN